MNWRNPILIRKYRKKAWSKIVHRLSITYPWLLESWIVYEVENRVRNGNSFRSGIFLCIAFPESFSEPCPKFVMKNRDQNKWVLNSRISIKLSSKFSIRHYSNLCSKYIIVLFMMDGIWLVSFHIPQSNNVSDKMTHFIRQEFFTGLILQQRGIWGFVKPWTVRKGSDFF